METQFRLGVKSGSQGGIISSIPGLDPSGLLLVMLAEVQIFYPEDLSTPFGCSNPALRAQKKEGHGKTVALLLCLAPRLSRDTKRPRVADPEVWFRIVHVTMQDNKAFQEQAVEITLGPKGAFEEGNIGVIKRRVPPDGVVNAVPSQLSKPKPQKTPRTLRVAELLRKAMEWKELLETGAISSQADIARSEGLSRARVTQIMDLLNLAPEILKQILSMLKSTRKHKVTERSLRPITLTGDHREQVRAFREVLRR